MVIAAWRQYETQIFANFRNKYPDVEMLFDVKIEGRHSKMKRQADIVVRGNEGQFSVIVNILLGVSATSLLVKNWF